MLVTDHLSKKVCMSPLVRSQMPSPNGTREGTL